MRIEAGGKSFYFDPDHFLNVELNAIEKATGMNAVQWQTGMNEGSMTAATALVWILEKRLGTRVPVLDAQGNQTGQTRPMLFDDVVFEAGSLNLEPEDETEGKDSTPDTSSATTSEPELPKIEWDPLAGEIGPTIQTSTSSHFSSVSGSVPGSPTG